jgi:hypothetical protein
VTSNAAGNAIGQYLMYVMPAGAKAGTVEFEARGFATASTRRAPTTASTCGACATRTCRTTCPRAPAPASSCASTTTSSRRHLLRRRAPVPLHEPRDERHRRGQEEPVSWDRNKWYRFKFQWSQTGAQWYKDGVLQGTLRIPSQNKSYRYVYVGSDYRKVGLVPVNVTYRNLRITSDVAGTWNVR